ncbi:hypothetical protein NMG60_11006548 [Bertholletia excelsa]
MAGVHKKPGLNSPCILLIAVAGMERFAFKGVASNLVNYLTDILKMRNSSAAKTVNSWCGFTSIMPLMVAPLADSYWDRYSTILVFSFIYVLGLLALIPWPWLPTNRSTMSSCLSLFWALFMISLGQGGYNPSLQAFGADQLKMEEELSDQNSDKKSRFFQWWYFGICSGSLLGVAIMPYIQDTEGWGLGFAIPAVVMFISVVLFSGGSRFYTHQQGESGGDVKSFKKMVLALASKMRKRQFSCHATKSDAGELDRDPINAGIGSDLVQVALLLNTSDGCWLGEQHQVRHPPVEIARIVIPLLPVWAMLLMFAVIFQQPATFFTKQGMAMKRNIGNDFKIPAAALQSATTVSIVLLMPLYDSLLVPISRKALGNEKGITVMQRMGVGMFLSVVAMVIAAMVEEQRLKMAKESETVALSIAWLLPQYILLGISDIFTVVGMQEFFYGEVPENMRTIGIALYTSVFGVGSFLSALLITVAEYASSRGGRASWFSDNMREAQLDKYYWLLALLSAFCLVIFVIFSKVYKSRA